MNKSKLSLKLVAFAILIISAAVLLYIDIKGSNMVVPYVKTFFSNTYTLEEGNTKFSVDPDSKSTFLTLGNRIVECTKDGVRCFSDKKEELWSSTFTLTSPIVKQDGNFIAVSEPYSNKIYVYNADGPMHQGIQSDCPIISFSINSMGYVAAIELQDEGYRIEAFNSSAIMLLRSSDINDAFPIATDISDDGRKLAVSFLDTSNVNYVSNIVFYYLNKDEANDAGVADGMLGSSKSKQSAVIPVINFMDGNVLVGISDQEIFGIDERAQELWSIDTPNIVTAYSFEAKSCFSIAYGEPIADNIDSEENSVKIYNLKGDIISANYYDKNIDYLYSTSKNTIVGISKNYSYITNKGVKKWDYTFAQDVVALLPVYMSSDMLFVSKYEAFLMSPVKILKDEN